VTISTDTVPAAAEARRSPGTAAPRPYAPSWLDLVLDRLEALPGPTWLAYAALLGASLLLRNVAFWLSGVLPPGQIDPPQTVYGVVTSRCWPACVTCSAWPLPHSTPMALVLIQRFVGALLPG